MNEHRPGGVHLDDEAVFDLAHGTAPAGIAAEYTAHLERCEPCAGRYRVVLRDRERARARWRLHDAADGAPVLVSALSGAGRAAGAGRRWRRFTPFAALAAGVAVVLLLQPWARPPRYEAGTLPPPGELLRTRGEAAADPRLAEGLSAFTAGRYAEAAAALDSARADGPADLLRRAYLGNAWVRAGEPARAAAVLEPVARSRLPEPWGRETRWTWLVALHATGASARADSLARVLAADSTDVGIRARGFLRESR